MGLEKTWGTLAGLITEFRKRNSTIPPEVMKDLRAAKTLIEVFKADPTRSENVLIIERYLRNVESYLIIEAEEKFGEKFTKHWMKKIRDSRELTEKEEQTKFPPRLIFGAPRGKKWIRIKISKETSEKEIARLAEESGLSYKKQKEGYMLIYGDDNEKLKLFVQKTAKKLTTKEKQKAQL